MSMIPCRLLAVLVTLLALTAACGSRERTTSPEGTPAGLAYDTATACPRPLESAVPLDAQSVERLQRAELWFDHDIAQPDRERVKAGLAAAESYLAANLGGAPPFVCIDVRASSAGPVGTARAQGKQILILTTPQGWPEPLAWHLQEVTAHEYAHIWQEQVASGVYEVRPYWLIEGMAEWLAFHALIDAQVMSREEVWLAVPRPKGLLVPSLEGLETAEGWSHALQPYSLSYHGAEALLAGRGPALFRDYLLLASADVPWQQAFRDVFGIYVADFYAQFSAVASRSYVSARGGWLSGVPAPSKLRACLPGTSTALRCAN